MKAFLRYTIGLILYTGLAAIVWAYLAHYEAFNDFWWSWKHQPKSGGLAHSLEKAQADLMDAQEELAKEQKINATMWKSQSFLLAEIDDLKSRVAKQAPEVSPSPVFSAPMPLPAKPHWTWTTSQGKVLRNVVISKVEADCVTILDDDGGGLVKISLLPADVQSLLNYNPELAAAAAVKRAKDDLADQIALENESRLSSKMALAKWQNTESNDNQILAENSATNAKGAAIARAHAAAAAMGSYQDDMSFVRKHVSVDSKTGAVSGDSYYLQKYSEDSQALSQLQAAASAR